MRLIEPKAELLEQKPGIDGMYEIIDRVAGVCYNRDGIHDDPKSFVDGLVRKGHMRPLEFGTVYLKLKWWQIVKFFKYLFNPYSEVRKFRYVTTNYRVIVEHEWKRDMSLRCEPTEYHVKRPCVILTCSRVTGDSFRTHITLSSVMRSTRYCNYENMEIVRPVWLEKRMPGVTTDELYRMIEGSEDPDMLPMDVYWYWYTLQISQDGYNTMVRLGRKRQEARGLIPLDAGTRLCLCGFLYNKDINSGWNRFFKMRIDNAAHDDAQLISKQIKELIIK